MAEIDRLTIEELGIPGAVLMENAGLQAVLVMERHFGTLEGKKINIFCGKGNNGGDGLVIARHLFNRKALVHVFLLFAEKEELKKDARINLDIARRMDLPLEYLSAGCDFPRLEQDISQGDLLIDAIFGTGLQEAPKIFYQQIIKLLNDSQKPIVAVDIPTGLCASTGNILGPQCIKAHLTVTFALPKIGLVCSPHRESVGILEVVDISIPAFISQNPTLKVELMEKEQIKKLFPQRTLSAHKGTFGHVLVIAGSPGKTGAGVMTAEATLRSGAGLATLGVPRSMHRRVETKTLEVMTTALPETSACTLSPLAAKPILQLAEKMEAIAIGPGLHTHPKTAVLVEDLIANLTCPTILDADGINNIPLGKLQFAKAPLIITPHPGEMGRLLGMSVQDIQANRLEVVQKTATSYKVYVVLKGDRTLIGDPRGNIYVNPTGNPGMATAGSGDILTGVIAGFLAQGFTPLAACCAGVYIHGLAGDLAKREKGECGMIARNISEQIPAAILDVLENQA